MPTNLHEYSPHLKRCFVVAVLVALLVGRLSAGAFAETRSHSVKEILLDGKDVATADVVVTPRDTPPRGHLAVGDTIADGTRLDVPAHVTIIVVSSGEKSTAELQPSSSVTFASTGSGELVSMGIGKAIFTIVSGTLDFFRVRTGEAITASVHGTIFSADITTDAVAFACQRGEVNIARTGRIVIGHQRGVATLVDVISSDGNHSVSYSTRARYLARFADFSEAEVFFQARP